MRPASCFWLGFLVCVPWLRAVRLSLVSGRLVCFISQSGARPTARRSLGQAVYGQGVKCARTGVPGVLEGKVFAMVGQSPGISLRSTRYWVLLLDESQVVVTLMIYTNGRGTLEGD